MIPEEEKYFQTRTDLIDKICGLLGGRAAEQIFFNEVSTGAHNDFERVTAIARAMVTEYGMSDVVGPMQAPFHDPYGGRQLSSIGNYSEEMLKEIDKEVRKIINECYTKVLHIIETHRDQLELIAQTLMKVETIDRKEIVALYQFGKMPKELDEKEAEQLDKVVNKKYYEEQARKAKEEEAEQRDTIVNKKYYEEQARLAKEKESGPELYVESADDTDNKDIEE